jgi:hypothetical protein
MTAGALSDRVASAVLGKNPRMIHDLSSFPSQLLGLVRDGSQTPDSLSAKSRLRLGRQRDWDGCCWVNC